MIQRALDKIHAHSSDYLNLKSNWEKRQGGRIALKVASYILSLAIFPLIAWVIKLTGDAIKRYNKPLGLRNIEVAPPHQPSTSTNDNAERLHALNFGSFPAGEREYEADLKKYYELFATDLFSSISQKRKEALERQRTKFNTSIVGAGPAGLIAAYEAYINGATVTVIEKRSEYSRDQILRISPDTHNYLRSILGNALATQLESRNLVLNRTQGEGNRSLFGESNFSTIEIRDLEKALSIMLKSLSSRDPDALTFYENHQFVDVKNPSAENPTWTIRIKDNSSNEVIAITTDILLGADGSNSKVREELGIVSTTQSSTSTYGAATFNFPNQFTSNQVELDVDLPQIVYIGAEHSSITDKVGQLQLMKVQRRRNNINAELEILSNTISPTDRARFENRFRQINVNIHTEIDFVKNGSKVHLQYLKDHFNWRLDRLPISRFFTSVDTVYVGCEFPHEFLSTLKTLDANTANQRQEAWFKAVLKAHLPDSISEQLKFRHSSIFPLMLNKTNSPYKKLESSNSKFHVILVGDSYVTPHFLTGSGAQHAINMSRRFGTLLSELSRPGSVANSVRRFEDEMNTSAQELHKKAYDAGMLRPINR